MSEHENRKEKRMRSGTAVPRSVAASRVRQRRLRTKKEEDTSKFIRAVTLTLSEPGVPVCVGGMGLTDQTHLLRLGTEPS